MSHHWHKRKITHFSGHLEGELKDIIGKHVIYQSPHDRIWEDYQEWMRSLPKYVSRGIKSEAMAYFRGLLYMMEERFVHWQLYLDGHRIHERDVPPNRWREIAGRHEWIKSGRPYGKTTLAGSGAATQVIVP